ncbi:acylneuraminate cytidylyltransferase family protein [Candidatus Micrarchaeota archaeon]|nr:acylneuraminate cytidylyltransferase family protein [Candidatus Micrarchaeota archaeon]
MFNGLNVLCTVCARGGSKGIPGKNRALIAGKPLIFYTFDTAKECEYLDDIIISTNDDEVIKLAKARGINVPFKRPENISGDDASKIEVVRHAVEWAERNYHKTYDIIVDLSIVSPLRSAEDIKNSIELLVNEKADNVFSVSPPYRNPYYNVVEIVDGKIKIVRKPGKKLVRRQDAPQVYDMNDSIYVWQRKILFEKDTVFNERTKMYIMPRERGIDIDEPFDLQVVSLLIERSAAKTGDENV